MDQLSNMIESLLIFQRYTEPTYIYAEHDMIYIYMPTILISSEDFNRLRELGWFQEDTGDENVYNPKLRWCCFV